MHQYGLKWRFEHNAKKSGVLVLNEAKNERQINKDTRKFKLGDKDIPELTCYTHVGVEIHVDGNMQDSVHEHVSKARRALNAMTGLGIREGGINPLTASKMYKCVCLPLMLYGSEVQVIRQKELNTLSVAHRQAARRIQCLPMKAANAGVLATLGWFTIEGEIAVKKMCYCGSLLRLPATFRERQILVHHLYMYRYDVHKLSHIQSPGL